MVRSLSLIAALLAATAAGADGWMLSPTDRAPQSLTVEPRAPAPGPNGLPDGVVEMSSGGGIKAAWYEDPTTRYDHGVIGDAVEAGTLAVMNDKGRIKRLKLPGAEVFEDRWPRIADLDGDGAAEVIAIRSHAAKGAGVSVYQLKDGEVTLVAATPFIGIPNRWLNIAAVAPLREGPGAQIAYVETPHIGGTLRVLAYDGAALTEIASDYGYSNHAYGARELRLSAVKGWGAGALLAVPDDERAALIILRLTESGLERVAELPTPARIEGPIGATSRGFVALLATGEVYEAAPSP